MESIRKILIERRITQQELADRMGTKQCNINRMLCGRRGCGVDYLRRVALALDVSVGFLLGEETACIPPRLAALARNIGSLHPDHIREIEMLVRRYQALRFATQKPQ